MNELFWRKLKNSDKPAVEKLLRAIENECVGACGRYLTRDENNDPVWTLRGKNEELAGFLINSRSTLMPVLCGRKEIPPLKFLDGFLRKKHIHSTQGILNEVLVMQDELAKTGRKIVDIFNYNLMSLDKRPDPIGLFSGPKNLILRAPLLTDINDMAVLQAGYEKEEVIPNGSEFSPAASRVNTVNIIKKGQVLAAEINNRLVGKINISAVSFTRYQVGGVYVHPDFRGMGIARRMATEFITLLINEGRGVTLFVKKANLAAHRLYESLGFMVRGDYRITYY